MEHHCDGTTHCWHEYVEVRGLTRITVTACCICDKEK